MTSKLADKLSGKFLKGICKNLHDPDCLYLIYKGEYNIGMDYIKISCDETTPWSVSGPYAIDELTDSFALFKPIDETIKCVATIRDIDSICYLIYTETKVIEFESMYTNECTISTWGIENLCGTIDNQTLYDLLYDTTDDPIFSKLN